MNQIKIIGKQSNHDFKNFIISLKNYGEILISTVKNTVFRPFFYFERLYRNSELKNFKKE